jgi:protein involved in polysaccharide export with SLBB domain
MPITPHRSTKSVNLRFHLIVAALFATSALAPSSARAQAAATSETASGHTEMSRAQLEDLAKVAEQDAAKTGSAEKKMEATQIRERLRDGDFQVGDRILLTVRGDSTISDTVTVRGGRIIQLPNIPDISLQGVLRSELQSYLTTQLSRYIKHPDVQTTSLVRIALLGGVGKPGFYQVPADVQITDAIMLAGGPSGSSKIDKSKIKRNDQVVYSSDAVQKALQAGLTIDQLNLRPGDEIVVGEKSSINWFQAVGIGVGIIGTVVAITHYSHR